MLLTFFQRLQDIIVEAPTSNFLTDHQLLNLQFPHRLELDRVLQMYVEQNYPDPNTVAWSVQISDFTTVSPRTSSPQSLTSSSEEQSEPPSAAGTPPLETPSKSNSSPRSPNQPHLGSDDMRKMHIAISCEKINPTNFWWVKNLHSLDVSFL